jgi:hypothetical protein
MKTGIGIGIGNTPLGPRSDATFLTGPTIAAVATTGADAWDVTFGAETITIIAKPTINTPTATFGAELITITG